MMILRWKTKGLPVVGGDVNEGVSSKGEGKRLIVKLHKKGKIFRYASVSSGSVRI